MGRGIIWIERVSSELGGRVSVSTGYHLDGEYHFYQAGIIRIMCLLSGLRGYHLGGVYHLDQGCIIWIERVSSGGVTSSGSGGII
jgi:predicted metal-dependent phosphotriesterase family hydrolase